MPQFELRDISSSRRSGRVRARTEEEAVRSFLEAGDDHEIRVEERGDFTGLEGWLAVFVDGQPAGFVRPYDRMRFRRD